MREFAELAFSPPWSPNRMGLGRRGQQRGDGPLRSHASIYVAGARSHPSSCRSPALATSLRVNGCFGRVFGPRSRFRADRLEPGVIAPETADDVAQRLMRLAGISRR